MVKFNQPKIYSNKVDWTVAKYLRKGGPSYVHHLKYNDISKVKEDDEDSYQFSNFGKIITGWPALQLFKIP